MGKHSPKSEHKGPSTDQQPVSEEARDAVIQEGAKDGPVDQPEE